MRSYIICPIWTSACSRARSYVNFGTGACEGRVEDERG